MPSATLHLDGRDMALAYNAPARYRLSTLGDPERFGGLAYACAILWACDPTRRWKSPEELAEAVEAAGAQAVNAALAALLGAPDPEKKSSSTSGPSPGSTSA